MKKIIPFICCLVVLMNICMAQEKRFVLAGTIEFEKRLNMYAVVGKAVAPDNDAVTELDEYKNAHPQFLTLNSILSFNQDKTLFAPVAEKEKRDTRYDNETTRQHNIIYTDLRSKISTTQKDVFEHTFLVKDSVRKIHWKITDETREIAGYTCRRANAVIMDSVYVVAFYTNQIVVPGGPESFAGLPGMILGVALPHENMTWFAIKVTAAESAQNPILPPAKGDAADNRSLKEKLEKVVRDFGNEKAAYLQSFEL